MDFFFLPSIENDYEYAKIALSENKKNYIIIKLALLGIEPNISNIIPPTIDR